MPSTTCSLRCLPKPLPKKKKKKKRIDVFHISAAKKSLSEANRNPAFTTSRTDSKRPYHDSSPSPLGMGEDSCWLFLHKPSWISPKAPAAQLPWTTQRPTKCPLRGHTRCLQPTATPLHPAFPTSSVRTSLHHPSWPAALRWAFPPESPSSPLLKAPEPGDITISSGKEFHRLKQQPKVSPNAPF